MYEYLSGQISEATPSYAVIDVGGVGYMIEISLNCYTAIKDSTTVKLFIHEVIREDAHLLFGFAETRERELFRLLLSVSGVGAATARMLLSSLTTDELQAAIASQDVKRVQKVKGIGAKTAQRILLELRDKVQMVGAVSTVVTSEAADEALKALVMLGFAKPAVEKLLDKIAPTMPTASVEELIKEALKSL